MLTKAASVLSVTAHSKVLEAVSLKSQCRWTGICLQDCELRQRQYLRRDGPGDERFKAKGIPASTELANITRESQNHINPASGMHPALTSASDVYFNSWKHPKRTDIERLMNRQFPTDFAARTQHQRNLFCCEAQMEVSAIESVKSLDSWFCWRVLRHAKHAVMKRMNKGNAQFLRARGAETSRHVSGEVVDFDEARLEEVRRLASAAVRPHNL
eukprot:2218364-Pleurochrysis_carterae.AAC.1